MLISSRRLERHNSMSESKMEGLPGSIGWSGEADCFEELRLQGLKANVVK